MTDLNPIALILSWLIHVACHEVHTKANLSLYIYF